MTPATFYGTIATLMVANPPSTVDKPVVDQMAQIGIVAGKPFDLNSLNAAMQNAVAQGAKDGLAQVNTAGQHPPGSVVIHNWQCFYNLGNYGTNYTLRAGIVIVELGANLPEDAWYPMSRLDANGNAYIGAHSYVCTSRRTARRRSTRSGRSRCTITGSSSRQTGLTAMRSRPTSVL